MTQIFLQLKIITTKWLQQAIVWQSSYEAVRKVWPKIKVGILKKHLAVNFTCTGKNKTRKTKIHFAYFWKGSSNQQKIM